MDRGRQDLHVPRRPRGRAIRARSPPPPPPPPRPRPPVPEFEELEPISYEVPDDLITGNNQIDGTNRKIAELYTEVASYRKEIYEAKSNDNIHNMNALNSSLEGLYEHIDTVRNQAKKLRDKVRKMTGVPYEEPEVLKKSI